MRSCLFAICLASPAVAGELPSPLHLGDLAELLHQSNPELSARRSSAKAAEARPRMVSQLEDPTLSLEWWQQPIDFSTVPLMLSVRQPLPWPGKLRARRDVAEREAATRRDQVGELERRLIAAAKIAFLDLVLAQRSLAINERDRTLLESMVQVSEARYRVGRAPQAAMLKTQEELLTVDNERLDLERARAEAEARLNALLHRAADAPLPPLELPPLTRLPDEPQLVARAIEARPDVKLARDAIAEAEARALLAKREISPELAVWAGYMFNIRGVDTFTTGVSTTLPILSARRRTSAVAAADAELESARAMLEVARRRAETEVRTALLQMDTAMRHEKLHAEKLIPLSELSLQSAQSAYQNDRIDFFSVLDAARMVRNHHLDHERYLIDYHKRLAELELAVGQELLP